MGSISGRRSVSSGSTSRSSASAKSNTSASAGGSSRSRSAASSAKRANAGRRKSVKGKESARAAAKAEKAARKDGRASRKVSYSSARLGANEPSGALASGDFGALGGEAPSSAAASRRTRSQHHSGVPTGTTNLQVSDSTRRRRNHEMDSMAAGHGRRVGDIRAAERARRQRAQYRKYILKIAAVIAAVLIVVFGSIFVYRSDLFAVENVTVTGVSHLTDQEVTQLAAVPDDSTLLRLDSDGIAQRLCEHPWVESVSVVRKFPNTVELAVTERTAAAAVKFSKKEIWVISTDGVWLSAATKADWKNTRRIVGVNDTAATPVAGAECTDEGILNALSIYDSLSSGLLDQVKSISAESAVKTTITLKGGVSVAFGDASDLELKEADITALLKEHEGKLSYINVRVPDRPTYRGLD